MWWIGIAVALAGDVVIEDFAGPSLAWTLGPGASIGLPPSPWDGPALACEAGVCEASGGSFVVTHHTLTARSTAEPGPAADLLYVKLSDGAGGVHPPVMGVGSPVPGAWTAFEVATVDGCGLHGSLDYGAVPSGAATTVWLDDLVLAGDVCAEFVDADRDGACLQGTDLDRDGLCVSAGEPAAPGVVVDPAEEADSGTPPDPTTVPDPPDTSDTSDTGAPTTPSTEEDPIHTGEAPVHDPFGDDTGGTVVKDGGCGCATGRPGVGWLALGAAARALTALRRRRARSCGGPSR